MSFRGKYTLLRPSPHALHRRLLDPSAQAQRILKRAGPTGRSLLGQLETGCPTTVDIALMGVGNSLKRVAADTSDTLPVVSEKYVASGAKLETSREFIPIPYHPTPETTSSSAETSFLSSQLHLSMAGDGSHDGDDSEAKAAFPTHNCATLTDSVYGSPLRAPVLDLTLHPWTLRFNHDAIAEMFAKDSWETDVVSARMLW
jgi:hypothetical protein